MDSDEPHLVRCKQLPSPISDRQTSNPSMGQHLGIQSFPGQVEQGSRESSLGPSSISEDGHDNHFQLDLETAMAGSRDRMTETTTVKVAKILKGKEKDWALAAQKPSLKLLDLPLDILKIVFKAVRNFM